MKNNLLMESYIKSYKISFGQNCRLPRDLEAILSEGVFKIDDTFFLKALVSEDINVQEALTELIDKTGVECDYNHLHIEDFLEKTSISPQVLLQLGFCFANRLKQLIEKKNSFEIIVSFSEAPICDCNVRFHLIRDGEKWLMEDLESYEEAIMIM